MIEKQPQENVKYKRHENEVLKLLKYLVLFLSILLKKLFSRDAFPEKQKCSVPSAIM